MSSESQAVAEVTTASEEPSLVVGVGASAGGLEALQAFFTAVPPETGAAFVVVQHIAPDFKSVMAEILSRFTGLTIKVAETGMRLKRDTIYLLPPRAEMIVSEKRLLLRDRDDTQGLSLPIDTFFRSLATCYGTKAVGVVLSGTGHDGTRGAQAIAAAGGLVLCQAPETAAFDGMPRSALATGVVTAALASESIPAYLFDPEMAASLPTTADDRDEDRDPVLEPVFQLLGDRFGVDFSQYRTGTIGRRVERRMRQRGCRTVEHYVRVLAAEPGELQSLYEDFLIGVTEFFRDPQVWQRLETQVLPDLMDGLPPDHEFRAWVVGTATGQEAYTLAMLVHEAASRLASPPQIRIFATDLHAGSIDVAGKGIYPTSAVEKLDPDRRSRYFVPLDGDRVQVSSELRRLIVFARHDVIQEPPFMKMDLITCRNMLIYFQPRAQQRVMSLLLFALRREGCLVLGPSEGVGPLEEELAPIDRRLKIFTKRRDTGMRLGLTPGRPLVSTRPTHPTTGGLAGRPTGGWGWEQWLIRAYDALLDEFAPDAVLVDASGAVVHTFGSASDFLLPPSGRTTTSVDALVRPELRPAVSTGLQRAGQGKSPTTYGGIKVTLPDRGERVVRVTVRSMSPGQRDLGYLVLFEESAPVEEPSAVILGSAVALEDAAGNTEHLEYLESELRYAREQVQATVEELEASNEELQAANEELVASNEELQSSNEELHSVNEELYTVNREYEDSIEQLTQLAGDLDNLMRCTDIGTIFVDAQLRIRRFTPAAARHVNLLPGDVGRPIVHLNRNVEIQDLEGQLRAVLADGLHRQQEVRHVDGTWYLLRLHPYRDEAGETTGVVITWVDIQQLRVATAKVAVRGERLQTFATAVAHELHQPMRMLVSFAELFERRSRELVRDAQAASYLDEVDRASDRLSGMLDGLLQYARVDSRGEPPSYVGLDDLLQEALQRLNGRVADTAALIDSEHMPPVLVDEQQIVRVFQEVLENAMTFSGGEQPQIEVSAHSLAGGLVRVEVRDHGEGIDERQAEDAFVMFRRLGNTGEERLGVGLAICQRIIERHGGEIAIEAHPHGGTVLWFTVPAAEPTRSQAVDVASGYGLAGSETTSGSGFATRPSQGSGRSHKKGHAKERGKGGSDKSGRDVRGRDDRGRDDKGRDDKGRDDKGRRDRTSPAPRPAMDDLPDPHVERQT